MQVAHDMIVRQPRMTYGVFDLCQCPKPQSRFPVMPGAYESKAGG